jgi:hypothetical protein
MKLAGLSDIRHCQNTSLGLFASVKNMISISPSRRETHSKRGILGHFDPDFIRRSPDAITLHRQAIEKIELRSLHGPLGDLCPGSFDSMQSRRPSKITKRRQE